MVGGAAGRQQRSRLRFGSAARCLKAHPCLFAPLAALMASGARGAWGGGGGDSTMIALRNSTFATPHRDECRHPSSEWYRTAVLYHGTLVALVAL